jgi:hypothetical protein
LNEKAYSQIRKLRFKGEFVYLLDSRGLQIDKLNLRDLVWQFIVEEAEYEKYEVK